MTGKRMKSTALIFTLLISSAGLSVADNHQGTSFRSSAINDSLTLLQGRGGNIVASTGDDGMLIIDNDYADMAPALKEAIAKIGDPATLKYILNTHWHGDHSGGNSALGEGVDIVAHDNVYERLSTRQEIPAFNMVSEAYPVHARPNITFPDSITLHFNDEVLTLKHYPNGHTDGDSVVFFNKANVIHMGDHMFYPMFPFVDISSGGNVLSYAKNVEAVLQGIDGNTIVVPGHGPLTDKQGLSDFSNMLNGTIAEVQSMKDAGLDLSAAQAKGLSKQWDQWNGGFIKQAAWISFIYASI